MKHLFNFSMENLEKVNLWNSLSTPNHIFEKLDDQEQSHILECETEDELFDIMANKEASLIEEFYI